MLTVLYGVDPTARGGLREGKAQGTGEIVRWASQHLNIEIGLALRSDRWVGAELLAAGGG
jgi:hypothetical protein